MPELIELDDWGYPIVSSKPVPPHLDSLARRAVSACPTLALRLIDVEAEAVANPAGARRRRR
jgi:ferredoxin